MEEPMKNETDCSCIGVISEGTEVKLSSWRSHLIQYVPMDLKFGSQFLSRGDAEPCVWKLL